MENYLITQINIANHGVYPFSKLLMDRYNFTNYYNNELPCFFWGALGEVDKINAHKSLKIVKFLTPSDCDVICSLVIGETSQLAQFFPKEYVKISARNINYDLLLSTNWDRVFICFGVSSKNIEDKELYDDINFKLTLDIINKFKWISNKIVIYSTCELWNRCDGAVDLNAPYDFYDTPYINSKHKLTNFINNNKNEYDNVIIIFPFNFNSPFRSNNFLFSKIFNSIINKTKIEIGDTYFYRDLIHPSYVVKVSIDANENKLVGSGRLTFVNDFIRELYTYYDLSYNSLVIESRKNFKEYMKVNEFYLRSNICHYSYSKLLSETINDINKYKNGSKRTNSNIN